MSQLEGSVKTCCIDGCAERVSGRGMCRKHYGAWWYQQNREKRLATNRRYYERNRAAVLARTTATHRERRATPEGREAEREQNRQRYHADPERPREKAREWYRANKEQGRGAAVTYQNKRRAARFGLTVAEVDAIMARGCAVCGASSDSYSRGLHLDHDHVTGKVRDALCHGCNTALGLMGDDPARLRAAADYIETHNR